MAASPAPEVVAYGAERATLLARSRQPGPGRRRALADLTDAWLGALFAAAVPDPSGIALVAVGGYGRGQLSPGSDLDVLLLHDGRGDVAAVADRVWYPVWDSGARLDHSVRRPAQARELARTDLAVLLGLLDARLVAGDGRLLERLRQDVLADWRRGARSRLGALRESCRERVQRFGEVAHTVEPELKEGGGGLRDVACLRAVAASWVADRPHGDVDGAAARLLDVRDALHLATGRNTDRLVLQEQDAVATRLGLADADSVLRAVAEAAREVSYAAEVTWRRVDRTLRPRRPALRRTRPPVLRPLGPDLLEHEGELVLALDAPVAVDPVLPLRAAATAAQHGLPMAPEAVARLAAAPRLPEPWPDEARDLLVALLGAGPPTVAVWEAMDQAGMIARLLPEWALVRSRPQRSAVHRFTVDRHLVETAVQAAGHTRRVARPDLLLVAALLHDIGKGRRRGDHSQEGAKLTRGMAARMGFPPADVEALVGLVRHHLLLADTATRRDLDDPATAASAPPAVGTPAMLALLHALTEADAVATGSGLWSDWRAGLVADLVGRTSALLRGEAPPAPPPLPVERRRSAHTVRATGEMDLAVRPEGAGWVVDVAAPDQRGLLAAVAGVLSLHRLSVRSADMRTEPGPPPPPAGAPGQPGVPAVRDVAVDSWHVVADYGDPPDVVRLREDLRRALSGRLDVARLLDERDAGRARARGTAAPARVDVVDGASAGATVLEVRAHDRPGLLHRLGRALALAGLSVRAARVATMGAEVVDVFYVVDDAGRPLGADRARETARILRDVAG